MFGTTNSTPLTFGKVLGGISKTLNVVNQVIPLYKEAKPMIQNAKTAFSIIKEIGNATTTKINQNVEKNVKPIKEKITEISQNNSRNTENKKGPTFFL